MYREPHLQRKSDLCAAIWYEWYNYKYGLRDEERAADTRALWCRCVDEFSEMITKEVQENPIYKNLLETDINKNTGPDNLLLNERST